MLRFLQLLLFLLLVAGETGCASKSPADSEPPPGVVHNPNCPDAETIRHRKQILIDPRMGGNSSHSEGKQ